MTLRMLGLLGAALGLVAVGCGDDGGSGGSGGSGGGGGAAPTGQVNEQVAQQNATTTIQASNTAIGGDGLNASVTLSQLGTSALGLVQPAGAAPQFFPETGTAKQAVQSGVCECDVDSCHFEGCTDDTWANGFTIDGDLSWAGGNVVADLHYTGSTMAQMGAPATTYDFTVTMDVVVGSGTIDGTVDTTGSVDASGISTTWESSVVFTDVTFNDLGCPTAGTLDVDATVSYVGQDSSGQATITFDGSGC